jgi:hypothetical protein
MAQESLYVLSKPRQVLPEPANVHEAHRVGLVPCQRIGEMRHLRQRLVLGQQELHLQLPSTRREELIAPRGAIACRVRTSSSGRLSGISGFRVGA